MDFKTGLHVIAYKHYNHITKCKIDVEYLLSNINKTNLKHFVKIYLDSSQFDVYQKIKNTWNYLINKNLSSTQEEMLIYILNMYCCKLNRMKRRRLKHL